MKKLIVTVLTFCLLITFMGTTSVYAQSDIRERINPNEIFLSRDTSDIQRLQARNELN